MTDIKPIGSFWEWIRDVYLGVTVASILMTLCMIGLNLYTMYMLGLSTIIFDIPLAGIYVMALCYGYLRDKEAERYYIEHNLEPKYSKFYKLYR